jgi:hypothetical protein
MQGSHWIGCITILTQRGKLTIGGFDWVASILAAEFKSSNGRLSMSRAWKIKFVHVNESPLPSFDAMML